MTCQELRDCFQLDGRVQTEVAPVSADVAEHIGRCPDCHRLVEAQKELLTELHRMRGSAPQIPASLDSAVLGNYRRHVSERLSYVRPAPSPRRGRALAALGWATAVAFAVVVVYLGIAMFFPGEHMPAWTDGQRTAQTPMVPNTAMTGKGTVAPVQQLARKGRKSPLHSVRRTSDLVSVVAQGRSLPTGFRSLMYCDELACAGTMEVIRVQLPAPILRLPPASAGANTIVSADVLVGPDGIVRGIRFVE